MATANSKVCTSSDSEFEPYCPKCGQFFANYLLWHNHVQTCAKDAVNKMRVFFCTAVGCPTYYLQLSALIKHVRETHDRVDLFPCPFCDTYYTYLGLLHEHISSAH